MIAKTTSGYIRHYRDNGQTTAYVEWVNSKGRTGRTEGEVSNPHMQALLIRSKREGVYRGFDIW